MTTAWSPSGYDRNGYPLVKGAPRKCDQCHNGNYNNTPNTCEGCHLADYNGSANPNHAAAGFSMDCAQCHDETAWSPSGYDHNGYPLVGAHTTASCDQCHNGNYNNTPNTCEGCHLADYNGTTAPNHTSRTVHHGLHAMPRRSGVVAVLIRSCDHGFPTYRRPCRR
ncbi:MAG: hypothetical protein IPH53_09455 [Flavobacteriales bacterium]|nr:hypothetical protein [Flavobacteriales bacterium]